MGCGYYHKKKSYFLSFEQFTWFKDKTINEITKVESYGQGILHRPELDADLSPERFPLQSKISNAQGIILGRRETHHGQLGFAFKVIR